MSLTPCMLLPYLVLAGCVFQSSWAQDPNCDYSLDIVYPTRTYYIYSPGYANNYSPGVQCRWVARCPTGYNCRLDCPDVSLPNSLNCDVDALLISNIGDPQLNKAEKYCGRGTLSILSTNRDISVGLLSNSSSSGGKFYCQLTSQAMPQSPSTCSCGYRRTNRIVNGQETGINEYTMMAGLVTERREVIKCGAVIIAPRYLLSAAHCVYNQNPTEALVVVGEHDVTTRDSPATQVYGVARFIVHPQFDTNTYDYDIAVVVTQQDIQFSDRVGPACLPFKYINTDLTGKTVTVLGWGTQFVGGPDSNVLRKVDLNVISQTSCQNMNGGFLTTRQLCTYTPGKDACQDDSGGPLLYTDPGTGLLFHVGIISRGRFCASANQPGINTKVSALLGWVESVTQPYAYCRK